MRKTGSDTPEVDNLKMPATLNVAALCKIADRNQITDVTFYGPLALDNAISKEVAVTKRLNSLVAVDPDFETGNNLALTLSC